MKLRYALAFPLLIWFLLSAMPYPTQPTDKDKLALTPPMGWNSWNRFGCDINEKLIKDMADAMVSSGMKDVGYIYVNLDDCWMAPTRDAEGNLQADPERFPNGIKALADYVHSRGLKLGIYSSAGTKTCQGYPASLNHEFEDARKFAEWGVDYLKYDNCYNQGRDAVDRYRKMRQALDAAGRPIVFGICEWGQNRPWLWAPEIGNLWRTTGDIRNSWESVMDILDQQVGLSKYARPGTWNDPDMLQVGNGGMTTTEDRAHFSLWCILAAPLLAGNDLRHMTEVTREILTNEEVIGVGQNPAGIQGYKIRDEGDHEVWVKPLENGDYAVALLNRGEERAFIAVRAEEIGMPEASRYVMRDLWAHKEEITGGRIGARVPSHGVAVFRVYSPTRHR
ncbi:MAG: glycoside hydrolase family 27 protein [Candidatus Aminicenantales bacterium]